MKSCAKYAAFVITALMMISVAPTASADELGDAMAQADALALFRRIGLQPSQAQQMIPIVERIQDLVRQQRQADEQRLRQIRPTLQQARSQLVAGQMPSEQAQRVIASYREQRQQAQLTLMRAVDREFANLENIFTRQQNQAFDWTPPESVNMEESMQRILQQQRVAMGRIQRAAEVLNSVKHLDTFNFVTARIPILTDYLSLYYRPDTPEFEQAMEIAIAATDQVRLLTEEQWQTNALDIAADLVEELGLMPPMQVRQRPGTVSWSALYRLFTNEQTLVVLRGLAG